MISPNLIDKLLGLSKSELQQKLAQTSLGKILSKVFVIPNTKKNVIYFL